LSPRHVNMTQWARMASNYIKYIVQHGERALFNDFSSFRLAVLESVLFVGCRVDRADAPSSHYASTGGQAFTRRPETSSKLTADPYSR
jgi:hypothetical protein